MPYPIRIDPISHAVFVSLSRNLSLILSGGEYGEADERGHFAALVGNSQFRRFVDIGANVGIYGFTFHSLVKPSEVILIEPDKFNAELLSRTIRTSEIQNILLIEAAVSDSPGVSTFYQDDLSGATGSIALDERASFLFRHHHRTPKKINVTCISLDQLFPDELHDPDLIKIDVEGAEMRVFRGGMQMLARSHPALIFECDADQSSVTSLLGQIGYRLFDFATMRPVNLAPHNCLALHSVSHAVMISGILQGQSQD